METEDCGRPLFNTQTRLVQTGARSSSTPCMDAGRPHEIRTSPASSFCCTSVGPSVQCSAVQCSAASTRNLDEWAKAGDSAAGSPAGSSARESESQQRARAPRWPDAFRTPLPPPPFSKSDAALSCYASSTLSGHLFQLLLFATGFNLLASPPDFCFTTTYVSARRHATTIATPSRLVSSIPRVVSSTRLNPSLCWRRRLSTSIPAYLSLLLQSLLQSSRNE
jgi:hypothetical protein